jgi:Domain of Unknown Function (DUF1080)
MTFMLARSIHLIGIALLISCTLAAQGAPPAPPPASGAGRGFQGGGPPLSWDFADHTGFTQIFDGKSLNGWDGTADIWSVQDGAIEGLSCPDKPAGTTFLIYKGAEPGDFELKMEFKLETGAGNSGIQYRSRQAEPQAFPGRGPSGAGGRGPGGQGPGGGRGPGGPGAPGNAANVQPFAPCANHQPPEGAAPAGRGFGGGAYTKWNVQGYQFDLGGRNTGNLWEGGRFPGERGTVSTAGQVVLLREGQPRILLGTMAPADQIEPVFKPNEWNQLHLIVRGYTFIHVINGHVFTVTIDDDASKRQSKGVIAIQVEGSNLRVSARDIWLKAATLGR